MPMIAILTNCPDTESADAIADALISSRLVACANRYAPIASRFHWNGAVEEETEHPLLLKTRAELGDAVEQEIRRLHPYETPAILRIAMDANADYRAWIDDETRAPGGGP